MANGSDTATTPASISGLSPEMLWWQPTLRQPRSSASACSHNGEVPATSAPLDLSETSGRSEMEVLTANKIVTSVAAPGSSQTNVPTVSKNLPAITAPNASQSEMPVVSKSLVSVAAPCTAKLDVGKSAWRPSLRL